MPSATAQSCCRVEMDTPPKPESATAVTISSTKDAVVGDRLGLSDAADTTSEAASSTIGPRAESDTLRRR